MARHLQELGSWHRQLVGAVHYVYLPYAEEYLAQDPTLKLVRRSDARVVGESRRRWSFWVGRAGVCGWAVVRGLWWLSPRPHGVTD